MHLPTPKPLLTPRLGSIVNGVFLFKFDECRKQRTIQRPRDARPSLQLRSRQRIEADILVRAPDRAPSRQQDMSV